MHNAPVVDHHREETVQPHSHHIPTYNSHEYHRAHVELLQGRFVSTSHQLIVDLKLRLIDQLVQKDIDEDSLDMDTVRAKLLQIMKETLIQCCKVAPGQSKARAKLSKQYHHLKERFHFTQEVSALSYSRSM